MGRERDTKFGVWAGHIVVKCLHSNSIDYYYCTQNSSRHSQSTKVVYTNNSIEYYYCTQNSTPRSSSDSWSGKRSLELLLVSILPLSSAEDPVLS